jgi:hypothetical protein
MGEFEMGSLIENRESAPLDHLNRHPTLARQAVTAPIPGL